MNFKTLKCLVFCDETAQTTYIHSVLDFMIKTNMAPVDLKTNPFICSLLFHFPPHWYTELSLLMVFVLLLSFQENACPNFYG